MDEIDAAVERLLNALDSASYPDGLRAELLASEQRGAAAASRMLIAHFDVCSDATTRLRDAAQQARELLALQSESTLHWHDVRDFLRKLAEER